MDLHGIVDAISTSSPRGWAARYRAIGISDLHLGTPGCQAEKLLDFLKHSESTYLYLVGDIIDGWALRRRWFWHQSQNDVVRKNAAQIAQGHFGHLHRGQSWRGGASF